MEASNRLAPVILFVYNRTTCTKQTLEALEENELAEESELYIFSDGPKYQEDVPKVAEVRDYIEEYRGQSVFKKVTVVKAGKNKGLAASVIGGVTEVIGKHGRVIVLEDDCITTKDFLRYMNGALAFYEENSQIWSVSGYSFSLPSLQDYTKDIYLLYRGSSWGWGTWKDRWETVDWDVSDYRSFRFSIRKRKKFARGGNDLSSMLKAQMHGKIDSWAIRWCYAQSMQDKLTVYPVVSHLCNIGFDETGVHCLSEQKSKYQTPLSEGNHAYQFEDAAIDKTLMKEANAIWRLSLYSRIEGFIQLKKATRERKKHGMLSMSMRGK